MSFEAVLPARFSPGLQKKGPCGHDLFFDGIVTMQGDERNSRVGGWLLVLCVLLLAWQPISFGLIASTVLGRISSRGAPFVLVLLMRLIVVGFGIAAGLALLSQRPGAVAMAKLSLALTAALDVFVYVTPYFPTNLPPGDANLYATASVLYALAWIAYLTRSKRVRALDR